MWQNFLIDNINSSFLFPWQWKKKIYNGRVSIDFKWIKLKSNAPEPRPEPAHQIHPSPVEMGNKKKKEKKKKGPGQKITFNIILDADKLAIQVTVAAYHAMQHKLRLPTFFPSFSFQIV